jgi:long-chain acyl-CoA synthetase
VAPEIVEEAIKSFGGIEDAAVFTRNDELGVSELWAAIVARSPVDENALRTHCAQRLERAFVPHHVVHVDRVPRNDMGKIERNRLPELLQT